MSQYFRPYTAFSNQQNWGTGSPDCPTWFFRTDVPSCWWRRQRSYEQIRQAEAGGKEYRNRAEVETHRQQSVAECSGPTEKDSSVYHQQIHSRKVLWLACGQSDHGRPIRTDLCHDHFSGVTPAVMKVGNWWFKPHQDPWPSNRLAAIRYIISLSISALCEWNCSGERLAAVTWIQSNIQSPEQRQLLFELNQVHALLSQKDPHSPEAMQLQTYSNLFRMYGCKPFCLEHYSGGRFFSIHDHSCFDVSVFMERSCSIISNCSFSAMFYWVSTYFLCPVFLWKQSLQSH